MHAAPCQPGLSVHRHLRLCAYNCVHFAEDKLKAVVNVDHGSRPLLKYMCTKFLNAVRSDLLYLARAGATDVHAQV